MNPQDEHTDLEAIFKAFREFERVTGKHSLVHPTTDKTYPIRDYDPHYTDKRFEHPQTVYLAPGYTTVISYSSPIVPAADYQYSDRLAQWDWEKNRAAWDAAKDKGLTVKSAAFVEHYLRVYWEAPHLNLVHILAGVNHSNGYPYQVFGYILEKVK